MGVRTNNATRRYACTQSVNNHSNHKRWLAVRYYLLNTYTREPRYTPALTEQSQTVAYISGEEKRNL